MKVAVTVFKNGVSPRLDVADRLFVYDVENGAVKRKEEWPLVFEQPFQLISMLRECGIKKIICGGCPQFLLRMLFAGGFEVLPGLAGDPGHVVNMLADGSLNQAPPCIPFGRRRRTRGNKGRNRINK